MTKPDNVIIDAGCFNQQEESELSSFIKNNNLTLKYVLNTHLHIDHIMGNAFLYKEFGLAPCAHENDEFLIDQTMSYASQLGIKLSAEPPYPGKYIEDGLSIKFGSSSLKYCTFRHTLVMLYFIMKTQKWFFLGMCFFMSQLVEPTLFTVITKL